MIRITKTLLAALWFLAVTATSGWTVEVGEPLPDFAVTTFEGQSLSRTSLEGKPLMLVFWNTWCPICLRDMPHVNRLAEEFAPRGLAVLAINSGINDSENKARAYWKEHNFQFPAGFDHGFEIGQAFGVRGVPTIFLIDAGGMVLYKNPALPRDMEEYWLRLTIP